MLRCCCSKGPALPSPRCSCVLCCAAYCCMCQPLLLCTGARPEGEEAATLPHAFGSTCPAALQLPLPQAQRLKRAGVLLLVMG